MNPDKAVVDFIAFCRTKAKEYTELADTVEAKLRANGTTPLVLPHTDSLAPVKDEEVLARAKTALAEKNRRMKNLLTITGASKRQLNRLLTSENGFETAERGWIKLRN
ncbi:MAG: hypothetical protein ACLP0A_12120 [Verrucomicrobiia bacterium]